MARREQLTAILIGNDRDRIGSEPLGLGHDLVLVHPDQRPQHLHRRRLRDGRQVLERLRRHLADDLTGDERARPPASRELLGDPQHQTPVDDDAQLGRHGEHHLLLQLAERHEQQSRPQLVLRQERRDLAHLLLRRARQDRIAVEVDEQHRAAAPHHAVGRDRRIDAARQQTRDATAGPGRQSAGARLLAEEIEGVIRQHLEVNRQLGIVEIDVPALRLLDETADFALDLRRRERQAFVGAPCGHAERGRSPIAEVVEDRRGERLKFVRRPGGIRKVRDAEDVPHPLAYGLPGRRGAEVDLDAAHRRPDRPDVEVGQGGAQVADKKS